MSQIIKNIVIKMVSWYNRNKYWHKKNYSIHPNTICSKLKISGPGKVLIEKNCNLWSFAEPCQLITYTPDACIHIQSGSRLNGPIIQARKKVTIGKNCRLGSTLILDTDFHNPQPELRQSKTNIPTKEVRIGNNVWLCGQSVVLKGVQIKDNSVLALRAVATKSIPANVLAAGNPAQIIKTYK